MQFSAPRIVTGVCFSSSDGDVATTFAEWPHFSPRATHAHRARVRPRHDALTLVLRG